MPAIAVQAKRGGARQWWLMQRQQVIPDWEQQCDVIERAIRGD